ncbi:AAA family ATPase [Parageobacillus toebii]|uniref:AAA family ATPase n=1 Tax=Parageobacillus toebii TaxID=153151 RepID=UPI0019679403|nr:AAA family ATPase [Parageobacillus toebii]MED4971251.1 AAA family ATPase [Parageobacillus toebii]QSB47702.1 AAA family ATPase [Parageobacillus toebii]
MRIRSIGIQSVLNYGAFELDFGEDDMALHILYGPNEAGKSTLLQVLVDLLFGGKIDDAFRDHYDSRSRIEGMLEHPGLPPKNIFPAGKKFIDCVKSWLSNQFILDIKK